MDQEVLEAAQAQGGDHSLPDRSETTCGLAGPPLVHLVWDNAFFRTDRLFGTFLDPAV